MRRVLPLIALSAAVILLVVGLGSALTAESTPVTEPGSVGNAPARDGTPQSKWIETDFGNGNQKKRS